MWVELRGATPVCRLSSGRAKGVGRRQSCGSRLPAHAWLGPPFSQALQSAATCKAGLGCPHNPQMCSDNKGAMALSWCQCHGGAAGWLRNSPSHCKPFPVCLRFPTCSMRRLPHTGPFAGHPCIDLSAHWAPGQVGTCAVRRRRGGHASVGRLACVRVVRRRSRIRHTGQTWTTQLEAPHIQPQRGRTYVYGRQRPSEHFGKPTCPKNATRTRLDVRPTVPPLLRPAGVFSSAREPSGTSVTAGSAHISNSNKRGSNAGHVCVPCWPWRALLDWEVVEISSCAVGGMGAWGARGDCAKAAARPAAASLVSERVELHRKNPLGWDGWAPELKPPLTPQRLQPTR